MPDTILVIEDDPDTAVIVTRYLERSGYTVQHMRDGETGLRTARTEPPALIVLDWMLPGLSGLDVLARLRASVNTPVIMLTARTEEADRILGLEFGADDYLVKPFSPGELVARVRAVLRRSTLDDVPSVVKAGELTVNLEQRSAQIGQQFLVLTVLEFDLLLTFARQPGKVFTRSELLSKVWGADFVGVDRVVDVHVSNLRQKLADVPGIAQPLETVRGVGYRLVNVTT